MYKLNYLIGVWKGSLTILHTLTKKILSFKKNLTYIHFSIFFSYFFSQTIFSCLNKLLCIHIHTINTTTANWIKEKCIVTYRVSSHLSFVQVCFVCTHNCALDLYDCQKKFFLGKIYCFICCLRQHFFGLMGCNLVFIILFLPILAIILSIYICVRKFSSTGIPCHNYRKIWVY